MIQKQKFVIGTRVKESVAANKSKIQNVMVFYLYLMLNAKRMFLAFLQL